jgi:hypothetical protein
MATGPVQLLVAGVQPPQLGGLIGLGAAGQEGFEIGAERGAEAVAAERGGIRLAASEGGAA